MATPPPVEAEAAILGPTSTLVRRVEIYESDGATRWLDGENDDRLIDGSVTIDYSRPERRSFSLVLDNTDSGIRHDPAGFWYDKIIKTYIGVHFVDTTPIITTSTRTNLITNPSFEVNTTGWAAGGGTITRDTAQHRWGNACLRQDSTGSGVTANFSTRCTITPGSKVILGVWARGSGTLQIECRGETSGGATTVTALSTTTALTSTWTWYSVELQSDASTARVFPIFWQRSGGTNAIYYDGALCEQYTTLSLGVGTGFDGDTQDFANRAYQWTGTAHASTSTEVITKETPTHHATTWETQVGEFMIDTISEDHFPYSVKVNGRDYTKKCLGSKFTQATAFISTSYIEDVIKAIAQNAGVTKFIMPLTGLTLGRDYFFERNTERWKAMTEIAEAFGFELFFDAQGYLVMREYQDPISAPLAYILETGQFGTLVSYNKTVNDTRIYNHIVVTGESSDSNVIPVFAEALNTEPSSPTRIAKIGDRVFQYSSPFITTTMQAQDVADKYLRIMALEEFDLNFSSISLPWLEVGEIVQFNDPREFAGQPTRFLLSSLTLPLGLGPMSGNAKRVSVVS